MNPDRLLTGDLVFTRSPRLVSKIIRICSSPVMTLCGDYVPSHVGIIRRLDDKPYVQEALWGRGFCKTPWEDWLAEHGHESVRVIHLPLRGLRTELGEQLELMEGLEYASLRELVRTIGNRNKDCSKRDFCSAACQRALERTIHERLPDLAKPDNTNPLELYQWARTRYGANEERA